MKSHLYDTWEVTDSTFAQRTKLHERLGGFDLDVLDYSTVNITIPSDRSDDLVEWLDEFNLSGRLV